MTFKSIKGTKDTLPGESHRWQHVEGVIREAMHSFNYREIRTPAFEEAALFARGIGELTDIVGKEMYTFQDRGGTMLALKPEMTASVIRAYIQHNLGEQGQLVKVYYISPMFRQERPQAGRLRQFHQFGAEAIGGSSAAVDAEIIALSAEIYRRLGIKNFSLRINSVGCEKCRPAYKALLKKSLEAVKSRLSEESQRRFETNPLRILDSKDETDRKLTKDAPLMKDHLCPECAGHFEELQAVLASFQLKFEIDGRIVRGLDYYTKTAYEIISADLGSQDALAGGGRYDLLVGELGGKPTPAVGFAAGVERLLMAMEKQGIPQGNPQNPRFYIAAADAPGRSWAIGAAHRLRSEGIGCEVDLLGRSLKAQMREADRQQAKYVVVVGENEIRKGVVNIKSMADGTESAARLENLIDEARRREA